MINKKRRIYEIEIRVLKFIGLEKGKNDMILDV
jgi:hypothetical protein